MTDNRINISEVITLLANKSADITPDNLTHTETCWRDHAGCLMALAAYIITELSQEKNA